MDNEADNEVIRPSIATELGKFIYYISSLRTSLDLSMQLLEANRGQSNDDLLKFLKENIEIIEVEGKEKQLIKIDYWWQFTAIKKRLDQFTIACVTVPRSYSVALVSEYDGFLGNLLRTMLHLKPELLNSCDSKLSYTQLLEFSSIDDATEYIIEKEVEGVIRESHIEHFAWMEKKFNLPLRQDLPAWPAFVELTERRNLFVHTNGRVSRQYLKVCSDNAVKFENGPKPNDELIVSPEYFEIAYRTIYEIGVKLSHVLWRKFFPDQRRAADQDINRVGYDLLLEEEYELAQVIFNFAANTIKVHSSDEQKQIFIVNLAQSYKWAGDQDTCKTIITKDWSALSLKFQLAQAVLLDDFPKAYQVMKRIGRDETEIERSYYKDWPLFKELKRQPLFAQVFNEIYGEPLNIIDVRGTTEVPVFEVAD